MNILIVGAGTVGTYLAEALTGEGHSIVIIDTNPERIADITDHMDVQGAIGLGSDHALLEQVGVRQMDLAMVMTNFDEINLVCALTCKRMGAARTVARVRNHNYIDSPLIPYRSLFEIDLMISPEMQTAIEIAKFLEKPDAIALETFAHGQVQMRQIDLEKPCPALGKPLADAGFPEGTLVAAITRDTQVIIPSGRDRLHLGDSVTIIGHPGALEKAEPLLGQTTPEAKSVVIMGGGEVGSNLTKLIGDRVGRVVLIERSEKRAKALSERFPKAEVILGDATKIDVLREERIGNADVFIATSGEDEDNIMATQLALEMGVKQSIVLVHRPDYASVIQRMGFDHVLSPRVVTAKHLLTHIGQRDMRSMPIFGAGAEIIELRANAKAKGVGVPLSELKLSKGTLICSIVHGGEMRVAHGGDIIDPGDTVIAIALKKAVKDLRAKFL